LEKENVCPIKPEYVYTKYSPCIHDTSIKRAGFGSSRRNNLIKKCPVLRICQELLIGTAPEIFLGSEYRQSADIYSFGVILWELITNQVPCKN
jgi:serine/threonine protein kinase